MVQAAAEEGRTDEVPDVIVDRGVEADVVDGEAAGKRREGHQRAEDDAMPVSGHLELVGCAMDGVALVVGNAARLSVAEEVRGGPCR